MNVTALLGGRSNSYIATGYNLSRRQLYKDFRLKRKEKKEKSNTDESLRCGELGPLHSLSPIKNPTIM